MNIARMVRNFIEKKNSVSHVANVNGSETHATFECYDADGGRLAITITRLAPATGA